MSGIVNSKHDKTVVWFSWKDIFHPRAGGAEVISSAIIKRYVAEGVNVVLFTSRPKGFAAFEQSGRYTVYRQGNAITCYPLSLLRYWRTKVNADVIVEEINTVPFFISLITSRPKVLFFHQLCKEVWFYQLPYMASIFGYSLEKFWLFLLSKTDSIVMSESTKADLESHGFCNIANPVTEGVETSPRTSFTARKFKGQILSFGSIRPMKRTIEQIEAFELAADRCEWLTLDIYGSGSGPYYEKFLAKIQNSCHRDKISYLGHLPSDEKAFMLRRYDVLLMSSVKEGWGLTITEAATQCVVTIAYNADGLRDAVQHNVSGIICKSNCPKSMAAEILNIAYNDKLFETLSKNAWQESFKHNFDNTFLTFKRALKELGVF